MLLCLVVCLTLLASFFLPSHLSLKHVWHTHIIDCCAIRLLHRVFIDGCTRRLLNEVYVYLSEDACEEGVDIGVSMVTVRVEGGH